MKLTRTMVSAFMTGIALCVLQPAHALDCREAAARTAEARREMSDIRHRVFLNNKGQQQHLYRMAVIEDSMKRLQCVSLLEAPANLQACKGLMREYRSLGRTVEQLGQDSSNLNNELEKWLNRLDKADVEFRNCSVTETTIPATPGGRSADGRSAPTRACNVANTFQHTPNQAIAGANIGTTSGVTVDQCKQLCLDSDRCKSFDYRREQQICFLSDMNGADVAARRAAWARPQGRSDWPTDYYERTCR